MPRKSMSNIQKSMENRKGKKSSENGLKNSDFIYMKNLSKSVTTDLSGKPFINCSVKSKQHKKS